MTIARLLTPAETATHARISVRTLKTHWANGTGPRRIRIGGRWFVREDHLAEWIEECERPRDPRPCIRVPETAQAAAAA